MSTVSKCCVDYNDPLVPLPHIYPANFNYSIFIAYVVNKSLHIVYITVQVIISLISSFLPSSPPTKSVWSEVQLLLMAEPIPHRKRPPRTPSSFFVSDGQAETESELNHSDTACVPFYCSLRRS